MNHTHPTPDDLATFKRLADRWLRLGERRVIAESQLDATHDESPLYPAREAEYDRLDDRLRRTAAKLVDLVTRAGAVAPRHIRIDDLIITVAPDAGVLDGEERIAIIDLGRPALMA